MWGNYSVSIVDWLSEKERAIAFEFVNPSSTPESVALELETRLRMRFLPDGVAETVGVQG
jgi:hypothetical protein